MTQASLRATGPRRRPVPEAWLATPATAAAPRLLGALLVRDEEDGEETVARIVETEAYHQSDPASHSHRGRTPRVEAMFGRPGLAYVYFTYGMHWCMNVTCDEEGIGAAVLLRAAVPVAGTNRVRERRGDRPRDRELLAGPARLAQGFGIDREWYGTDLLDPASRLRLETDGWVPPAGDLRSGPRVGVREAADVAWRFWIGGVAEVSRYSRHPKAPEHP